MAVRIGWSRTSPDSNSGRIGRGLWLFELHQVRPGRQRHIVVGYLRYRRVDLEALRSRGEPLDVIVVGLLRLDADVTPALVDDTIASVRIVGRVSAASRTRERLPNS